MGEIIGYIFFGLFFFAGVAAFVGSAYTPFVFWLENGYWNESPTQIIFGAVFLLTHGGVGFAGLVYLYFNPSGKKNVTHQDPSKPWLTKTYWSKPVIDSDTGATADIIAKIAQYFALVSTVVVFAAYESIKRQEYEALWGLLIPIIGCGLYFWSRHLKQRLAKYGRMPLSLNPYPASIGGHFGGEIRIAGLKFNPVKSIIKIECLRHYRSGKNTRTEVLWQESMSPALKQKSDGYTLQFCFTLPDNDDARESQPNEKMPYIDWRVITELVLKDGTRIKRKHSNIPVFKTAQSSSLRNPQAFASQSKATQSQRAEALEHNMNFERIANMEYAAHYPAGRNWWGYLVLIIGAVFIGVGLYTPGLIFNIVFPLLGGLTFLSGVYHVANSLTVNISVNGIYTDRFIFGYRSKQHVLPIKDFTGFKAERSHSTSTGSNTTQYYNVVATGLEVRDFVVTENIQGRGQVAAAIEHLQKMVVEVSN